MLGLLAKAKAGHDKDKWYIIIEETDEFVWLADGVYKTFSKPKKKRKKHIQICYTKSDILSELAAKLNEKQPVRDEEIKRALKLSKQSEMEDSNV